MTFHVLDQLPLWVEGDLNPSEMAAVEGHLAECPACRDAAERLKISQAWLRDALDSPFGSADHAQLRRTVMDQIRKEPSRRTIRRLATRPALLAACAATLLVATLVWRQEHTPGVTWPPPASPAVLPVEPAEAVPVPLAPLARHDPARAAPDRVRPRPSEAPTSPPSAGPARIEFQTSDPNVRIIWLAQAKPLPEATLPPPEVP